MLGVFIGTSKHIRHNFNSHSNSQKYCHHFLDADTDKLVMEPEFQFRSETTRCFLSTPQYCLFP